MPRLSSSPLFPVSIPPTPSLGDVQTWVKSRVQRAVARATTLTRGIPRTAHPDEPAEVEALETRLTAGLRLILALITVLIAVLESTMSPLLVPIAVAYLAYASVVYVAGFGRGGLAETFAQYYPVDAGAFLLFISLAAGGTSSSYFTIYLLLFAVTSAAFTWGTSAGLRLTLITALALCTVLAVRAMMADHLEAVRTILSLGCILGVGTMAAHWGGHQFTVRRRLVLLRDAGVPSNPRFGIDRTIDVLLERLREFYDAEACLLTTKREGGDNEWCLYRCERRVPENAPRMPVLRAKTLLWLPRDAVALYVHPRQWWAGSAWVWSAERKHDGRLADAPVSCSPGMEALLRKYGGRSWLSVPVYADQQWLGRLHIVGERAFAPSDADFVLQVMERGMLLVENIRLVDQLATTAALRERQRVARDIHDGVIQPYIGLQLGLTAVQATLKAGDRVAAEDKIHQLIHLTGRAIDDLRKGAHELKSEAPCGGDLLRALRLYAAQFTETTGIRVDIHGREGVRYGDRLAADLFHMAVEALSNVRRHTIATHAAIRFTTDTHHVRMQVENQEPSRGRVTPFMPRSLAERATSLGGCLTVDRYHDGRSIVDIKVPL